MFCSTCGANNDPTAKFCHACGAALTPGATVPPPPPLDTMRGGAPPPVVDRPAPVGRNPVLAAILSLVIPGVGQFYNGDTKKGLVMLAAAFILGAVSAGLLWLAVAIWSAVDGYRVADGTSRPW